MNAGAAVYVAGIADTLVQGVEAAAEALDDGRATEALDGLREAAGSSTSG